MEKYTLKQVFYNLFKTVAFKLDPEVIHDLSIVPLKLAPSLFCKLSSNFTPDKKYQLKSNNLDWSFPVGLAAGFDKDADILDFLSMIGFGSIEIGTVTLRAQPGNLKPRIFRYPENESLRNSMGFPSIGADKFIEKLKSYEKLTSWGINIGKNKLTNISETPNEYALIFNKVKDFADYIVINVSSPNTPGLRDFQSIGFLKDIIGEIKKDVGFSDQKVFLKIAPDLEDSDINKIVDLTISEGLSGIVATNTSIMNQWGQGGMSGNIIQKKSSHVRELILKQTKSVDDFDLIGVGGFSEFSDIEQFWKAGGKFIQIYTSFIYNGPEILTSIQKQIDLKMKDVQVNYLSDLIKSYQ